MKVNSKYLLLIRRKALLIILLSFLPFIFMFNNSLMPHTQDGSVHLARIAAHFKALTAGEFPPRWAADLNYGYGMPIFIFMYPLPYFLSSFFLFLGTNLVLAYKLVIISSFLLSGIFMYLFIKEIFDQRVAFLTTLIYQFAPFRLVEANIRGDVGEIFTYSFLPLVLWGILKKNVLIISLGTALLILSHNSIRLVFFLIATGFALFFSTSKINFFKNILGLLWGLALSGFYWLPALLEHKYTYGELFMRNVYKDYFTPLYKIFLPNFFNSASLNMGDVPVQIGIVGVIFLILSMILFLASTVTVLRNAVTKKPIRNLVQNDALLLLVFSFLVFLTALFFTQPVSGFFWEKIPLLRQFQFPWRFMSVIVITTTLQCAVVIASLKIFKNKLIVVGLIVLTIISTVAYWKTPFGYDKVREADYWNYPRTTTYYGETDSIWAEHPASSYPRIQVETIGGTGEIKNLFRGQTVHKFQVLAQTDVHLIDHTWYFPGWRVFANGKEIPVEFQDPNHRGIITFRLPQGEHIVRVEFTKTKDRLISEIISVTAFALWLMSLIFLSSPRKRGSRLLARDLDSRLDRE